MAKRNIKIIMKKNRKKNIKRNIKRNMKENHEEKYKENVKRMGEKNIQDSYQKFVLGIGIIHN